MQDHSASSEFAIPSHNMKNVPACGPVPPYRKKSALKDRLFNEILGSIFRNTVNLGTGAILLIAGTALQDGTFTVGDFSLFVYYLGFVTDLTALTGIFFPMSRN